MIGVDRDIVTRLNEYAGEWPDLDRLIAHIAFNDAFKGAVPVAALWWLWFRGSAAELEGRRSAIAALIIMVIVALAANRALASALPHTERPVQALSGSFVVPGGMNPQAFSDLSAFPSDHAVMFMGLATGVIAIAPFLGSLLILHAVAVVLLPRVYLGLHWPSDLVVGGAFGAVMAWMATRGMVRDAIGKPTLAWERRHPSSFYAVAFLLTWQLAALFDPLVDLAQFFVKGP